jgi:HEAT repeat protein
VTAAADALVRRIRDPAEAGPVVGAAVAALGEIGGRTDDLLRGLEGNLAGKGLSTREAYIEALAKAGPAALPALERAARSPHVHVREAIAAALGVMGPPAAPAVPTLERMLVDVDGAVRRSAVDALGRLGPEGDRALLRAIAHPDDRVLFWALMAVSARHDLSRAGLADAVAALGSRSFEVRAAALAVIASAGEAARAREGLVAGSLTDPAPLVRARALAALPSIGAATASAVPAIAALLGDPVEDLRVEAFRAIGRFGEGGRLAEADIVAAAAREPKLRFCALDALARTGIASEEGRRLAHDAAGRALGMVGGEHAREVHRACLEGLSARRYRDRAAAARRLAEFAPALDDPDAALAAALGRETDRMNRGLLLQALGDLGAAAEGALPALERLRAGGAGGDGEDDLDVARAIHRIERALGREPGPPQVPGREYPPRPGPPGPHRPRPGRPR